MPTTLPVRIALRASTVRDGEADRSIAVVFLVTVIGMLLSVLAALISPDLSVGL
jgi:hypothetical protein